MDGNRFDGLAKGLADGSVSRRSVLGGLVGVALGLLGLGGADAAQRCRGGGFVCRKNGECCSGACVPSGASGRRLCACASGTTPCGTGCCDSGSVCTGGANAHCCTPVAKSATCRGKTGTVRNNCGEPVDCCVPLCSGKQCGSDGCGGSCGACSTTAACSTAACDGSACVLQPIPGCCTSPADCDDGNPCTADDCVDNTCRHSQDNEALTCGGLNVCQSGTCCTPDGQPFVLGAPCCNGAGVANPRGTEVCGTLNTCVPDFGSCVPGTYCCSGVCGERGACCTSDGVPWAPGTDCCSGAVSNPGSGQICGPLPCTPTTCAAQSVACGDLSDNCGATLHCGTCDFGKSCSNGRCIGCSSDSDCTAAGPCQSGTCDLNRPGFRGICKYVDTCTPNNGCETATCENGACVRAPVACPPCQFCNVNTGTCGVFCPACQTCDPNVGCVADTSRNNQSCDMGFKVCSEGQCLTCLPQGTLCDTLDDRCCGGCRVDLFGTITDPYCHCLISGSFGCRTDGDCCSGPCTPSSNPAGGFCGG